MPIEIKLLIFLSTAVSAFMIPIWYRTFFSKEFIGLDRTVSIEWSDETTLFKGVYFLIRISLMDVQCYEEKTAFLTGHVIVKVTIKTSKNRCRTICIGPTIP